MHFTDDERKSLMATHSLVRDEHGRELLIGLTERESLRYMLFLRKGGSRYRGDVEMHNDLRRKHDRARAEAIEALALEIEHNLEMQNPPWK